MKILVECYTDTLFLTRLGYECVADHSNIGNVANRMKNKFEEHVVLGIVDDDLTKPLYFDNFKEIRSNQKVVFLKHKTDKRRFLIFMKPDIEGFISFSARQAKLTELIIPKTSKVGQNKKLVAYIDTIINKKPDVIDYLKACIDEASKAE